MPKAYNIRIRRCRLYRVRQTGGAFRGYCASKRRYFYGLKVHLVITTAGLPVQVALTPGSVADVTAFQRPPSVLAEGSRIFADSGYLDDTTVATSMIPRRHYRPRPPASSWWPSAAATAGVSCRPGSAASASVSASG